MDLSVRRKEEVSTELVNSQPERGTKQACARWRTNMSPPMEYDWVVKAQEGQRAPWLLPNTRYWRTKGCDWRIGHQGVSGLRMEWLLRVRQRARIGVTRIYFRDSGTLWRRGPTFSVRIRALLAVKALKPRRKERRRVPSSVCEKEYCA